MARYQLRLSYDGGPFRGFAPNEGVPTVGGAVRDALEKVLQHDVPIVCAGRTDAGVHALDQVVSFDTDKPVAPEVLRTSLNSLCRPYIVVSEVQHVADDFDARFSCTGRSYRYRILNQRLPDPFRKDYTWRVSVSLDVGLMQEAGQHLLGTHDFSSFCRRQFDVFGDERIEKPRVRTLRSVEWTRQSDDEIHLIISATSFCQQMVRSITGMCVDVGLERLASSDVPGILEAKDRKMVQRVAPPHGLYLLKVMY
jgi:tRNA pseudouridine38-40 synthase